MVVLGVGVGVDGGVGRSSWRTTTLAWPLRRRLGRWRRWEEVEGRGGRRRAEAEAGVGGGGGRWMAKAEVGGGGGQRREAEAEAGGRRRWGGNSN